MKDIKLLWQTIKNFKGISSLEVQYIDGKPTIISGQNAVGKTTIFDNFTWILFGKDSSGSEKFQARPLDLDGNLIDNIDICGDICLSVDGEKHIYSKTQKQKWVKKRGSTAPTFQGNVNAYEIDGYPVSEADFKKAVAEIIDEKLFRLLTNPTTFTNMPWKDQRKILVGLFEEMTNTAVAEELGGYELILPELKVAKTTDDIQKKHSKTLTGLKKEQNEIPVRIDTLNSQIAEVDTEELMLRKDALSEELDEIRREVAGDSNSRDKRRALEDEYNELCRKANDIRRKDEEAHNKKRDALRDKTNDAGRATIDAEKKVSKAHSELLQFESVHDRATGTFEEMRDKWKEVKAQKFKADKPAEICPTCGQKLTEKQIADNMLRYKDREKAFIADKEQTLSKIKECGTKAQETAKTCKSNISEKKKEIKALEKERDKAEKVYKELHRKLNDFPAYPESSKAYLAVKQLVIDKAAEIESLTETDHTESFARISEIQKEISDIDRMLGRAEHNKEIVEQIEELTQEQKNVAQKIADTERIIDMVQNFVMRKMELIGSKVNDKFDGVNFKLFDVQINGGIKEVCECTVDGVPYGSLNNGHRIVAGLEIIRALQQVYGVKAPIFIDNAEAINDFNIPKLDSQMILLKVTDDDKLTVK